MTGAILGGRKMW